MYRKTFLLTNQCLINLLYFQLITLGIVL